VSKRTITDDVPEILRHRAAEAQPAVPLAVSGKLAGRHAVREALRESADGELA
jgi:hypothetical protein